VNATIPRNTTIKSTTLQANQTMRRSLTRGAASVRKARDVPSVVVANAPEAALSKFVALIV
jgi:hypothetical protein